MADTVVRMGDNSPEQVAFKLLKEIAYAEDHALLDGSGGSKKPDRTWILDTYAQCYRVVNGLKPQRDT